MREKAKEMAIAASKSTISNKVVLLDAGHGGLIDGVYTTPGKRAYFKGGQLMSEDLSVDYREDNCDFKYYEGVGNRAIRDLIAKGLDEAGIKYEYIDDTEYDLALSSRSFRANEYCDKYGIENCIFISIHSNGFSKQTAKGFSFYTSIGQTKSDVYAEYLYEEAIRMWPNEKVRTDKDDGDLDKEANFKVLRSTKCAAILGECFFHTNPREVKEFLMSNKGRQEIADVYCFAIERMLKNE